LAAAAVTRRTRCALYCSLILAKLLGDNPQGNLSKEQVKFAHSIYAAGNDLLDLINDILDISKVEAGKLELSPEEIFLGEMVGTLKSTFEPMASQKRLRFEVSIDPGTPATLVTDRQRVEQILKNLLSNAMECTETGEVSLTVSTQPGGQVAFSVQDSGIGIAPNQQQLIFDAFHQADGTTSRRHGGPNRRWGAATACAAFRPWSCWPVAASWPAGPAPSARRRSCSGRWMRCRHAVSSGAEQVAAGESRDALP